MGKAPRKSIKAKNSELPDTATTSLVIGNSGESIFDGKLIPIGVCDTALATLVVDKAIGSNSGTSTPPLHVDTKSNSAKSKAKSAKAKRGVDQFLSDLLPNLKKEMTHKKKVVFDLTTYDAFFKHDSGYIATYLLPLFHFLAKTEIVCTRYGNYEGKHMVKTSHGFERVMILARYADPEDFTADIQTFCTQKYGKEWFKIPQKDGFRAKAAASAGHEGCFRVILTGVFLDSFINADRVEVHTINPVLTYESCRAPPPKKEKKPRAAKKTDVEEEIIAVGAQENPMEEEPTATQLEDEDLLVSSGEE